MIPYVTDAPDIEIPANLLPVDGRFGSGPSKVRPEAVEALAAASGTYLGTSHRQRTVKSVVGSIREGLRDLFSLPDGYEVVLGNGGTTFFWDTATFCLIERKSQHLSFGEFSSKFATAASDAPHLEEPEVISVAGRDPSATRSPARTIDLYALTHNETSTGVMMPINRPDGAKAPEDGGGLVAVDATSGAGGLRVDAERVRRLLLRAAEVLRLRRRALAGPALPGRSGAGRPRSPRGDGGCPRRWTSPLRSRTRSSTRPTTHRRSPPCSSSTTR